MSPEDSSSAQCTTSSIPTIPRRQRAQPGEHMWALGRAAPTPLVPSAQREAATGSPYSAERAAPSAVAISAIGDGGNGDGDTG